MESIARKRRVWKKKVMKCREGIKSMEEMSDIDDIDVKLSMIQSLIPIGLDNVRRELQNELVKLAGAKGRHGKKNVRWGRQWGSVYLLDQKVPVNVPRVRNKGYNIEIPLELYQKLQHPYKENEQAMKRLLNGLSMNKYAESSEIVPEVFGLSASNMSRRFKISTATKLKRLMTRGLGCYDFTVILIDGKRFAEEGIVVAVGITADGNKIILGISQMNTENHKAVEEFFNNLIGRGLRFEEGLLFVIDGSQGFIKAIRTKFKDYGLIQRCQYHKRENVVSHLSKGQQMLWRNKLKSAYTEETYDKAKDKLEILVKELEAINPSAANSLREGLEETLTLHKLEISGNLRRSFSTTNCIESILAQVEQYTQRVDYWRNGAHIQRWVAAGLMEVEPGLCRVRGWRNLGVLRSKIKEVLKIKTGSVVENLVEVGV